MPPTTRPATTDDADAIADVRVRAWQATYRGSMPDAYLDGLDPAEIARRWRTRLAAAAASGEDDGARAFVVTGDDERVVGVCAVGPDRDGADGAVGELWMINVAPEAWGGGFGVALLDRATTELATAGFTRAKLWVVSANARARRFYEREGWRPDGVDRVDREMGFPVHDLQYVRPLGS
ncbi:MAG: hypothetical protein JWM05_1808 [Acidimicrobiales bacterium]|nr:hypothetical protein [Acidimicrobiales bacterium]